MRECLGWLTNCSNVQSCPQNWLERSVTELPVTVHCHVCRAEVALTLDEASVAEATRAGGLAAFPVVPPIGLESSPSAPARTQRPTVDDGYPVPQPVPPERAWICRLASGETIRIDRPQMVIGRSRTCDIVIPSAKVSRQHASLTLDGGELWIEDLGSANGVWYEGEKISRTAITSGDAFVISDETLYFEAR